MVYFDKKYGWEKIKDIGLHTIGSVWTKDGNIIILMIWVIISS